MKQGSSGRTQTTIFILAAMLFSIMVDFFVCNSSYAAENNGRKITVIYFYYEYCKQCNEAGEILDELKKEMQDGISMDELDIRLFDASNDSTYGLLKRYYEEYDVPDKKRSLPIVFIGDTYLHGKSEIKDGLKKLINRVDLPETRVIKQTDRVADTEEIKLSATKMINIFFAGFINGLNPCSLSLVLMFISMFMVKKISVKKMGFAFATSKFITFFLLGTFLYSLLSLLKITWFEVATKALLLIFIITIVLLNIRDYFFARNERYDKIRMQLPARLRRINQEWIKSAVSGDKSFTIVLMSFLLGVLITFGEFLCTGQIYLATIIYVLQSSKAFTASALLYLLEYDIAFILPLLIITVTIDRGREIFDISEALRQKLPAIKLINACFFLVFGLFIIIFL
jgi:Cytochrome c biogenesis protein